MLPFRAALVSASQTQRISSSLFSLYSDKVTSNEVVARTRKHLACTEKLKTTSFNLSALRCLSAAPHLPSFAVMLTETYLWWVARWYLYKVWQIDFVKIHVAFNTHTQSLQHLGPRYPRFGYEDFVLLPEVLKVPRYGDFRYERLENIFSFRKCLIYIFWRWWSRIRSGAFSVSDEAALKGRKRYETSRRCDSEIQQCQIVNHRTGMNRSKLRIEK